MLGSEGLVRSAALLALDASTDRLCIAVQGPTGSRLLDEPGGAAASIRIVPAALQSLDALGLTLSELDAVAFGRGPGAFTGLRTACAVAQGLAFGASKPVLALDSLLIVADDAREQLGVPELEVRVAMDARMQQVYTAAYRWRDGRWSTLEAPALCDVAHLAARWQAEAPRCVAGSALDAFGSLLPTPNSRRIARTHDRAAAMLRVAQAAWQRGEALDAGSALPLYLRDKVAQTTAERNAARAVS